MSKQSFFILMPPPNVSGSLHMGHALTLYVQDFILRCQEKLLGKTVALLPGYDHGGISTEWSAKKHGAQNIEDIKNFAEKAKENIKEQIELLNLSLDNTKCQYTFDKEHGDFVAETFVNLYNRGYIKLRKALVNFDTKLKTAISDLEITHEDKQSYLYEIVYVGKENITVLTQRPETIFADCAIAVHPDDQRYAHLVGEYVQIPIINRKIPIITSRLVDMDFGTGMLKVTPAHDPLDYQIWKEHGAQLPLISLLDENGNLILDPSWNISVTTLEELRQFIIAECNPLIRPHTTRIPIGKSSGAIIEPLLQEHWFLEVSRIREEVLKQSLNIYPDTWINTYKNWLMNLEDWFISRTNLWGHPIPVWHLGSEKRVSIESPGPEWKRDNKILDTWFSSSLWPLSYKKRFGIYPTDVLVTAYDILFFWVCRMVLMSYLLDGSVPFKDVFIHRLVCDKEGKKMSKTVGNVVDPRELLVEYGTDVLRFTLLRTVTPLGKIYFSEVLLEDSKKILTKFHNLRFFVREKFISNNKYGSYYYHFQYLLNELKEKCIHALREYQIHIIVQSLIDFLYLVCDQLVEISKIQQDTGLDKIFNQLEWLLSALWPETIGNCSLAIFEEGFWSQDFADLMNRVKLIRFLQKNGSIVSASKPHAILEHLCRGLKIDMGKEKLFDIDGVEIYLLSVNQQTIENRLGKITTRIDALETFLREFPLAKQEVIADKTEELITLKKELDLFIPILSTVNDLVK